LNEKLDSFGNRTGMNPAMVGIMVGMGLMFLVICTVLRMFARARFLEQRSLFTNPTPLVPGVHVASLARTKSTTGDEEGRRSSSMAIVRKESFFGRRESGLERRESGLERRESGLVRKDSALERRESSLKRGPQIHGRRMRGGRLWWGGC